MSRSGCLRRPEKSPSLSWLVRSVLRCRGSSLSDANKSSPSPANGSGADSTAAATDAQVVQVNEDGRVTMSAAERRRS
jgi:hypothetical protein